MKDRSPEYQSNFYIHLEVLGTHGCLPQRPVSLIFACKVCGCGRWLEK